MLVVTRLIFRYAEPHSMASPGRVDVHKGKINSPRVRGSVFLWIMSLKVRSGAGLNGHKCHNRSQKLGFGRGFASCGGSRAEQRHGRDILVSARASDAAGDVQMAAPAQGRRPLRVVSGLPRRSAGVGTLAQPAFSSVSRNTFPSSSSLRR
jgi:hypothetical protein